MSPLLLAAVAGSGLFAGFVHVVSGPDHLAAIAPYAVDARGRAWRTGVRWGMGHSAGVLGVGVLALLLRDVLNIETVSTWGERLVGVVLIFIGAWGVRSALHGHGQPSLRLQHSEQMHRHRHPAFAVGTVHGLAGSSHLLGILPALALPSSLAAAVYLALFSLGSIAAMGTFSSIIGWVAAHSRMSGAIIRTWLLLAFSTVAVATGAVWLLSDV